MSVQHKTSGGNAMLRKLLFGAFAGAAMIVSTSAFAQGTAAEAKAMLDKAVAAVKADKAKAIASFNAGTDGFKDRDLYPFCFNISDGITQAAPPSVRCKDGTCRSDRATFPCRSRGLVSSYRVRSRFGAAYSCGANQPKAIAVRQPSVLWPLARLNLDLCLAAFLFLFV